MLVLSRKPSQRIMVGDAIRITVVAIQGGRVRIGIEAPPDISVLRGELGPPHDRPGLDPGPAGPGDESDFDLP